MSPAKITMQTLADELNVSRATISYILAGQARNKKIPPETEKRVYELARKYHFVPNYWARNLALRDQSGVGMLFPDITFSSTQEVVDGIQSVLTNASDKAVQGNFLSITFWDPLRERSELESLLSKRIAGLICLPGQANDAFYLSLRQRRFPMVYVTDKLKKDDEYFVMIDGADAVNKIFDHLEHLGHRRIIVIGPDTQSPTTEERYHAARLRLKKLGIDPAKGLILTKTSKAETVFSAVAQILRTTVRPTAIIGINDAVAYQIMHQIMEEGLKIGQDVALAGIGDLQISQYHMLSLTTVQERRYEFGKIAANLLMEQISGTDSTASGIRLKGDLIVRKSSMSAPPKQARCS